MELLRGPVQLAHWLDFATWKIFFVYTKDLFASLTWAELRAKEYFLTGTLSLSYAILLSATLEYFS